MKLAKTIAPLGDHVAIIPDQKETQTASGIVIPDNGSKDVPNQGTVIALGKGGTSKDCPNPTDFLAIDDRVIFGQYTGDTLIMKDTDGKDVTVKILQLDHILGTVSS